MDLTPIEARLRAGEAVEAAELLAAAPVRDRFGSDTVGLVWDTFALARVTAHLDVDPRHHQPFGLVHGGVWCTVVESMASFGASLRARLDGQLVVGVSNTTDFLRSLREGRVDAVAEPIHVGRSQQLWQVVLTRAVDGEQVARGQVRLQHVPPQHVPQQHVPDAPAGGAAAG